jgi:2'-hydroxyisoflavone reductase
MTLSRRSFLKLVPSLTACASAAPWSLPPAWGRPAKKKLLIFGGTAFLGPAIVRAALARGHEVTLFNRGRTRTHLFPEVERIVGNRDPKRDEGHANLAKAVADGRKWDAVIDDIAAFPRPVLATAELLKDAVPHYVIISSISAYADNSKPDQDETAPVAKLKDETVENYGKNFENYGGLKALCEQAAQKVYRDATTVVRPGFIVGPEDNSDRFTWWPVRFDRGGEMLAPGTEQDPIQVVDVRDLGAWLVTVVENGAFGTFNACGPAKPWTMGGVIEACRKASGKDTKVTWVPADFLQQHGVGGDGAIPIWMPPTGESAGFHRWSNKKAIAAGLAMRDPDVTTKDTLEWWRSLPAEKTPESRARTLRGGLPEKKEQDILAAWKSAQTAK